MSAKTLKFDSNSFERDRCGSDHIVGSHMAVPSLGVESLDAK
jgi:hypothetical protein